MASNGCLVYINVDVAGGEGWMRKILGSEMVSIALTTTKREIKRKKEKGLLRQGLFLKIVSRSLCSALLRGFVVVGASGQKH